MFINITNFDKHKKHDPSCFQICIAEKLFFSKIEAETPFGSISTFLKQKHVSKLLSNLYYKKGFFFNVAAENPFGSKASRA